MRACEGVGACSASGRFASAQADRTLPPADHNDGSRATWSNLLAQRVHFAAREASRWKSQASNTQQCSVAMGSESLDADGVTRTSYQRLDMACVSERIVSR